ncbi:uncharacterized protein LOC128966614 isoform X2 [Homo sapiens]|uniref:uncharacterized protein LOC128966614 isoform X2 n=1 Tax=Homo sapiens TaxID=9606 RepID=UPI0023DFBB5B|nr:uncharacterized protein LOC128966614 isoform X2 [Homo sapiens]
MPCLLNLLILKDMYSFPTTVVEEILSLSLQLIAFPTVSCEILLEITSQTNKKQTRETCYAHSAEEIGIIAGKRIHKTQAVPYICFLLRHQFISQSSHVRVEALYSLLFLGTLLQVGKGQEVLLKDALRARAP